MYGTYPFVVGFFICHNILRTDLRAGVSQNHFKALICIHVGGVRCAWKPEEGMGPSESGVADGREPPDHLMWVLGAQSFGRAANALNY